MIDIDSKMSLRKSGQVSFSVSKQVRGRGDRRLKPRVDGLEARSLLAAFGDASMPMTNALLAAPEGVAADRISTDLLIGYNLATSSAVSDPSGALNPDTSSISAPLMTDDQGRVGVDITTGNADGLVPYLEALGVDVVSSLPQDNRVEGFMPWSALPAVSNLGGEGLMGIIGVPQPESNVGLATSQGVNVLQADRVQASTPGYNGAGVKVGVLSGSYNSLNGASGDIASGDLPASGVQVIQEGPSGGTDEGRAMLQIVHDVAPGASLAFATASVGEGQFATNIQALADADANVITDDYTYFDEPMFQEGIVAQAVDNVATKQGVSYFSSAGNFASQSYDSSSPLAYGSGPTQFSTTTIRSISPSPSQYYNFNPTGAANPFQTFTLNNGGGINLSLEWDQPYYTTSGVTSDLDIYVINQSTGKVVAAATSDNLTNQTPFERVYYQNTSGSAQQYEIAINLYAGPAPGRLKTVNYGSNQFGNVAFSPTTNSSTITPHAGSPNAAAVAAAPFRNQKTTEGFSSSGPTTLLFDPAGNRLPAPLIVSKPDFVAPDGVDTTFFGSDSDTDGYPNFFGTSAAAPHAAGVAALYLQANPGAPPTQVYSALKASADPNVLSGNPSVPSRSPQEVGAGLIDAYKAIFGAPSPVTPNTSDGFESGVLGNQWQVYTTGAGRVQVSAINGPSSGAEHLVLDASLQYNSSNIYFITPELDEAILHLDLNGRTNATLGFDEKKFTNPLDATPASMPASFVGHGSYDGVSFSVDGVTWYRVVDLANSSTTYTTRTFNLSQVAASLGLTLSSDTQVKFQQANSRDFFAPKGGIAFDNVQVTALSSLTQALVENGDVQRSAVRSIATTFLGHIASAPSAAFVLTRTEDGEVFPVVASTPVVSGASTGVALSFGGPDLNGTSLPDGHYVLTIDGSRIIDDAGNPVDAANTGIAGSLGTLNFYRFFGDVQGNGVVDATDYLIFLSAYLSGNADGPNSIFDYDGNGTLNITDLTAFNKRFRQRTLP